MADQSYTILQQVIGADKVSDLSAKLAKSKEDLLAVVAAERAAGNAIDLTNAKIKAQADIVAGLSTNLKQAQSDLKGFSVDATRLATNVSYLADDMQQFKNGAVAGMQAIGNNIGPLLAMIPKIGFLGPVLAIAATGAAVLYEHWEKLLGAFGSGKIKTEAEQIEELGKKANKTADEIDKLHKMQRGAENVKAQEAEPRASDC